MRKVVVAATGVSELNDAGVDEFDWTNEVEFGVGERRLREEEMDELLWKCSSKHEGDILV